MKQLMHVLIATLFLALLTGCGGSSTPLQEGNIHDIQLSADPEGEDTPATVVELAVDPEKGDIELAADTEEGDTPLVNPATKTSAPALKLSVSPAVDEILLNWNAVDHAVGYELQWGEMRDILENSMTFDASQIQYLHQDLEPETIYYYRIMAKYAGVTSGKTSKIVAVKTGSVTQIMQSDVAN